MFYVSPSLYRLYDLLPSAGQDLMASAYAKWSGRTKYGNDYRRWRAFLDKAQWWGAEEVSHYKAEQEARLLQLVRKHSPFYREAIEAAEAFVGKGSEDSVLRRLPLINKALVRNHYDRIKTVFARDHKLLFPTSGTTGQSLFVPATPEAVQREYAYRWLYKSAVGAELGDRFAVFTGHGLIPLARKHPPFHVRNRAENAIMFSVYHIGEETVRSYCEAINEFRPEFVYGYPSALYALSVLIAKHGIELAPVKAVFPTSEKLHPWQRTSIQQAFGAPTYNYYAQVELTVNVQECPEHRLHVREEYGLLELIGSDGQPVGPGETGRIVGTGYGNPAFPLLRYDTGDLARLATNQECPCGRGGRIIEEIIGRDDDLIVTEDGRFVGSLEFVLQPFSNIREAQIVQESLNEFLVRIVANEPISAQQEALVRTRLVDIVGSKITVRTEQLDKIPRSANGKFRYVLSHLGRDQETIQQPSRSEAGQDR